MMKPSILWGSIGAAAAVVLAAGLATLVRVYGNDQTDLPLKDVAPDSKRFPQYIQTKQGHWLYFRKWTVPQPEAIVFLAHGFAEYSGRYEHVAKFFTSFNINVYAVDHQGHGQSTGTFTYFQRFQHVVDDFLFFVQTCISGINEAERSLPKFLFGHSMGGAVAIHAALTLKDALHGVILSAPMVAADPTVATPTKVQLAKLLSNKLPKLPMGGLDINTICSDPTVVTKTRVDRLYSDLPMVARVAHEFLLEMEFLQSAAKDVTFPYLLFYGSDDKITSVEGISLWHNSTQSTDKKSVIYPNLLHETFNERECEVVLESITKWIREHLDITISV